jgi:hypothetical protein
MLCASGGMDSFVLIGVECGIGLNTCSDIATSAIAQKPRIILAATGSRQIVTDRLID